MQLGEIKNMTVLVRVNYDLPNTEEISRIQDSLETVRLLQRNNNKVIIASHWGRPKGFSNECSLQRIAQKIAQLTNKKVRFINQFDYFENSLDKLISGIRAIDPDELILLENARFHKDERSKKDKAFELAKKYSQLADYFVDEAFAVSHRKEVTNYYIKDYLEHCNGLSFQNELKYLDEFKNSKTHPKYVVMGGAKLETKLPIIEKVLPKMDKVFICGVLCYTFLQAQNEMLGQNVDIKDSPVDTEFLGRAKTLLSKYSDKIVLPIDLVFGDLNGSQVGLDLGHQSLELFSKEICSGGQIFWNGPLGQYEVKPYEQGTVKFAEMLVGLKNTKIYIGGGDTVSVIPKEIQEKFDFISMGGGATLNYLVS